MKDLERKVEPKLTQILMSKATRELTPMSGTFELTPLCNFACKMCYVRKSPEEIEKHPRKMMTLEEWINIAEEAREKGLLYLLITGGEPFLWPDFWKLYDHLSKMGFLISINSNGTCIDERVVERLMKYPPIRINITLYGAGEESYQRLCGVKEMFVRVDKAITLLQKAGITVKLNGTLTPDNASDLEACIAYAASKELIYEASTYMFPPLRRDETMVGRNERFSPAEAAYYRAKTYLLQNGETHYHNYMKAVAKESVYPWGLRNDCEDPKEGTIRCRAGRAAFWVTWDGMMSPCGMMTGPTIDIKEKTFSRAWEELVAESGRLSLTGICQKCPNQKICHACAAMSMAETGTTEGVPVYLCYMMEEYRKLARLEISGEKFPERPLEDRGNDL